MQVQLQQVIVPIDFHKKTDKIKHKPIAELIVSILNVQDELQDRLEKLLLKKNKILWIQSSNGYRLISYSLNALIWIGTATLLYGMIPIGGSLVGIGGGFSYIIDNQNGSMAEMDYEIGELSNQHNYMNSVLSLLEEFDNTDNPTKREELVKGIWVWYKCQNDSRPIVVEDILWTLQNYLAPDFNVRKHFTIATDQNSSLQVRKISWSKLEEEMHCGFRQLKVQNTYLTRPQ